MKGVKAGVGERGRAREGMAVLMKETMWQDMVEYKEVNSRIIWVKVRMGGCLLLGMRRVVVVRRRKEIFGGKYMWCCMDLGER